MNKKQVKILEDLLLEIKEKSILACKELQRIRYLPEKKQLKKQPKNK